MSQEIKLSFAATRQFWELPVLYQDDSLLAVNKPAGLMVSRDPHDQDSPSLMHLLHAGIAEGKGWARERGLAYLSHAHRLDADASGVLLMARSKPLLVSLADLFGSQKPLHAFVALVNGSPAEDEFEVDANLAPHPLRPDELHVDKNRGKRSRTFFKVLERFGSWTLLQCLPATQRLHQIRAHLRHLRLPVTGDELYGGKPLLLSRLKSDYRLKPGKRERPLTTHPALHAERLEIPHPVTRESLRIEAPWSRELTVAVKYLRRYTGAPLPNAEPETETEPEPETETET